MKLFIESHQKNIFKTLFNLLLCLIIIGSFIYYIVQNVGIQLDFTFLLDYRIRLIDGFILTIGLSICSLILSLVIGSMIATGKLSKIIIVKMLCNGYVTFIRGTPLIMQIYLFYYIVGTAFGVENKFLAGVVILSVFESAYIAEIIRGSLLSIDKQQIEVAKSVGFSKKQTIQFVYLPQLFTRTLPALTGQFASIIKDSSLLSIIAIIEITQTMKEISATNLRLFEVYIALGILYLLLTLPIDFLSKKLEKRFDYAR